jgi:hypothetical protein
MVNANLPSDYEKKLEKIANSLNLSKEQLAESILRQYLDEQSAETRPFELGRDLFGKFGSGDGSLSTARSRVLKERLREKHHRR